MNSPLPEMDMNELVTEISAAEPRLLAPETVRRCLNLFSELLDEEVQKGRRVEIEWLGTFSLSPTGRLAFAEDPARV